MCGRFALYDTKRSKIRISHNMFGKNYNIAPSSIVPIIVNYNEIRLISWSFKVPWADNLKIINARSETLDKKKIFLNAKRCIFIANGYFEWLKKDRLKIPYYHTFKNKMMYFAGIYNNEGACIITRKSYHMKFKVHNRQPVILQYKDFANWFDSEHNYNCEHSQDMDIFEVTCEVNSTKNNTPNNVKRIK